MKRQKIKIDKNKNNRKKEMREMTLLKPASSGYFQNCRDDLCVPVSVFVLLVVYTVVDLDQSGL